MKTLDQIHLRPHERAAVQEAARILRERFPVQQVVLFGSKARGDDDPESDIDLLVLTSIPFSWAIHGAMIEAISPIQSAWEVIISLLVVAAEDWSHGLYQVLPIRKEVERDGVAA